MKKPYFAENEIYHIFNRGVEKRKVFLNDKDYFRFIHYLYEFNDLEQSKNIHFYTKTKNGIETKPGSLKNNKKPRNPLVEILAFCLMPNHFHLLLRQKQNNGIVKFMQKLGTGYTMYFNKKLNRVGSLFQGRFKAVLIKKEAHFLYIPVYIHLNPLDLVTQKDPETQLKFLENYRWSSLPDYMGIKNFPSVINKDLILELTGGEIEYKKEIETWVKNNQISSFENIIKEYLINTAGKTNNLK